MNESKSIGDLKADEWQLWQDVSEILPDLSDEDKAKVVRLILEKLEDA